MHGEGTVTCWTCQMCLQSFVLEVSRWAVFTVGWTSWSWQRSSWHIHREPSMSCRVGQSQSTLDIPIHKVMGENENCAFYFTGKKKTYELLGRPSIFYMGSNMIFFFKYLTYRYSKPHTRSSVANFPRHFPHDSPWPQRNLHFQPLTRAQGSHL